MTGLLLAVVAVAYLGGNAVGGRIRGDCYAQRALARANVVAGAAVAATWIVTPELFVTLSLFATAAIIIAARTVVGTTYGFALAGERNLEVGSARAAITHIAYLGGSLVGGGAIAIDGRASMGIAFGLLRLLASMPYGRGAGTTNAGDWSRSECEARHRRRACARRARARGSTFARRNLGDILLASGSRIRRR